MNNASNALVKVAGMTEKDFNGLVKYEPVETLVSTRAKLEKQLSDAIASGASRFSDSVQLLKTRLTILNTNISLAS